jgi:hypothetical protein
MFVVNEAESAAIRAVFEQEGELSAAIELRRLFPGITDNAKARIHARTIAGWLPLHAPVRPATVTRPHPRKERQSPRYSGQMKAAVGHADQVGRSELREQRDGIPEPI